MAISKLMENLEERVKRQELYCDVLYRLLNKNSYVPIGVYMIDARDLLNNWEFRMNELSEEERKAVDYLGVDIINPESYQSINKFARFYDFYGKNPIEVVHMEKAFPYLMDYVMIGSTEILKNARKNSKNFSRNKWLVDNSFMMNADGADSDEYFKEAFSHVAVWGYWDRERVIDDYDKYERELRDFLKKNLRVDKIGGHR